MAIKKLYSLLLVFLVCFKSHADCFIAKENNIVIEQEGICPKLYKELLSFNLSYILASCKTDSLKEKPCYEFLFVENLLLDVKDIEPLDEINLWLEDNSVWRSKNSKITIQPKIATLNFNYKKSDNYNNYLSNLRLNSVLKITPDKQITISEQLINLGLCAGKGKGPQNLVYNILIEEFIDGWKLYGKTIESYSSNKHAYQTGWFFGRAIKGDRQISFINYIEDEQRFNSSVAKRAKEIAKEYLRSIISSEYSYNDLLQSVPSAFVTSIKEIIVRNFSKNEIDNIKFKKLFGGLSESKLFLVKSQNKKYVLRLLDNDKEIELRKSEISAHKIGSNLKIAPKLIATDSLLLIMLMDFVEGRTMKPKDLNNPLLIKKIMKALKKFHNYSGNAYLLNRTKLDTIKMLYAYYNKKEAVYPSGYDNLYKALQRDFVKFNRKYLPSHGDLNPANIIIAKDGNIYFIDWSEARVDNPLLDVGWLAACTGADVEQTKNLLKLYLEKEPTISEFKEVLYFKNVTNFLVATVLIAEQGEKDQAKLDSILNTTIKKSSEYKKEGITTLEISRLTGDELTLYALSWLKEFIDNQLYIENVYEN